MCNLLLEKDAFLDLPEPDEARARGLIHDLDSTYSDYKKTGQQSKQIDLYFHARHLGLPVISHEVAMHCAYLEVLEIISSREPFPNSGAYSSMADFLEKKQLMLKIIKEFADYKKGKDNLPLIALSVADYLSTDKAYNKIDLRDKNSFDEFFKERAEDIVSRYYYKPLQEQRPVSALGTALIVKKGYDRMLKNKEIISTLLYGTEDAIAQLEQKAPKL